MTEQEIDYAIAIIATHYGKKAQSMQACEECGEAHKACSMIRESDLTREQLNDVGYELQLTVWQYGATCRPKGMIYTED